MLNYIRAELYKVTRRKYLYITELVLLLCAGLLVAGFVFVNAHGSMVTFYDGVLMGAMFLSLGHYLTILVGDMVFSEQYKFNTLKNEVSFGIPRSRIYLGKLVVEMVVGVVMALVLLGFYLLLCHLFLPPDAPELVAQALTTMGYCVLVALPQWFGVMALANMACFLVKGTTAASFTVACIVMLPSPMLTMMSFLAREGTALQHFCLALRSVLPTELIGNAAGVVGDWAYMGKSWLVGLAWIGVCTAIGLITFRKKEIS